MQSAYVNDATCPGTISIYRLMVSLVSVLRTVLVDVGQRDIPLDVVSLPNLDMCSPASTETLV